MKKLMEIIGLVSRDEQRRRVTIGLKIFLGFCVILLVVLLGNLLFISQFIKLNTMIQSTSSGMYRIALAQKMRRHLIQEKRFRGLYYTTGASVSIRRASDKIDSFVKNLKAESKRIRAKYGREPNIMKEISASIDEYCVIADSVFSLVGKDSLFAAHNLLISDSLKTLVARINGQISTANKRYGLKIVESDFGYILEAVRTCVDKPFYIAGFEMENAQFCATAESLSALFKDGDSLTDDLTGLSDTLLAIFDSERVSGKQDNPAWNATYSALSDPLEDILIAELSGVSGTLEHSRGAVGLAKQLGIFGTIILFLLGIVLALVISRKIASPIAVLREATDAAKRGEWDRRIQVTSTDEIGDLTEDFNAMLAELGKVDEMKSRFLASITHDLKSPIGRVRGNIANIQDGLLGPINDGQRELLDMMTKDIDKLSRLIHDILDLQKMKAGAFKLDLREVEIKAFILNTLEQHTQDFIDRDIDLRVKLDIDDVKAEVDPRQLERVLDNLVVNAIKYTSVGGKIFVEADVSGGEIVFSVMDSGVGIPKEHLEHIFDEFYQAGQKVKGVKGTGLGLTIAKQIVEAHGGRIWVESKPQVGTVFAFAIPLGR